MPAEDIRHPEKQPSSSKGGRKKYKRQKKVHVFETVYTFNFILGMIMITQLIKLMITFHWSKFFGNFSFFLHSQF